MTTAIVWFRRDLRLSDNPALQAALKTCSYLLPIYIHAPEEESAWQPGSANRWWLDKSLNSLDASLRRLGSRLIVRSGPSLKTLCRLCADHGVTHVYWNRLYEPDTVKRDRAIQSHLRTEEIHCQSCNASLLFEPWQIHSAQGAPYRVFTAFWKTCIKPGISPHTITPMPLALPGLPGSIESLTIDQLRLKPTIPWDTGLDGHWQPGETGALLRLDQFLHHALDTYPGQRDMPGIRGTSCLSPHLHFGEIGPQQILQGMLAHTELDLTANTASGPAVYLRELGWREFAHHLLYHYPYTSNAPLDQRFQYFPWKQAESAGEYLTAWQRGQTGIPIVDAGMRELWQTGWMHNRVRMIVASFLTKNLGIHWLEGARWFWDTLVDADLANNTLGWQWTAGCGADAAPFFRIFNPVRQSERFDPQGQYLRKWLPELATLPDAELHAPWKASAAVLASACINLGTDYPWPLVDLMQSRQQALNDWERIKSIPHKIGSFEKD